MAHTNTKSQELEVRNIMQGLEEFASFMSFRGSNGNMRIISVDTIAANEPLIPYPQVNVASPINLQQKQHKQHKVLSFTDRPVH